jgi:hypothetical protein
VILKKHVVPLKCKQFRYMLTKILLQRKIKDLSDGENALSWEAKVHQYYMEACSAIDRLAINSITSFTYFKYSETKWFLFEVDEVIHPTLKDVLTNNTSPVHKIYHDLINEVIDASEENG